MAAAIHRARIAHARHDHRSWVMERRERTRQLIALGGLVHKAGLVDLTQDDRAAIYGALLSLTDGVEPHEHQALTNLWRRRGKRAFEAEAQAREADAP